MIDDSESFQINFWDTCVTAEDGFCFLCFLFIFIVNSNPEMFIFKGQSKAVANNYMSLVGLLTLFANS